MSYNPNLFSVTNILSGAPSGSCTSTTTTFTAPQNAQVQAMTPGAGIPYPQGPAQMPSNQLPNQMPGRSEMSPISVPSMNYPSCSDRAYFPHGSAGACTPTSTLLGPAGIVSVNPNATVVQTPNGNVQMLQPGVGYTGLANAGFAPPTITPERVAKANAMDMTAPGAPGQELAQGPNGPLDPVLSSQPIQGNQVPNYYNIENTPSLQAFSQYVQNIPQAVQTCDQASSEAAQALLQAQHRSGNLGPLGIQGVTSNEYLTSMGRRNVSLNRPPSNQVFPPLGIPGNGPKQPVVRHAYKQIRNHQYCPELYMTPYDRTQNKIATGVLTNPYTGEVFQTFEEGMPLPQKNDSLLPSQLRQTNPKLVALQGGIDYNAPPPSKQEIAQNVPLINGGPNVWGDALYQPQLRQWFDQRAVMNQWNNRNGILPNYGIQKERPAGFVGDVNMLRPVPYNPATQRNAYDLKGYTTGVTDANYAGSMDTWNVVKPVVNNLDPNRGQEQTFAKQVGIVSGHGAQVGVQAIEYNTEASIADLRATQKTLQETPVPVSNIMPDQVEGYIYNPPDLKATNKTAFQVPVPIHNVQPDQNEGYIYNTGELKATNKTAFQVPVPIHNVNPDLPHTEIDLTASSEKTETRRQYYEDKAWQTVSNISGEGYSTGVERGPQPYVEWTRVAKRGGTNAQQFRVVPNRVTDSLSNQGNFSNGCSDRDVYPEQPDAYSMYGSFVRPSYGDNNAYQQTDFSASLPRPLPATSHCFKKGDGLEQDTSRYTLQAMPLALTGSM